MTQSGLLVLCGVFAITASAQQSTTVSGSVRNSKSKEAISAVSVTIKGASTGTFTDDKGNFRFSTVQKPPFTLVFSSVGYKNKEVVFKGDNTALDVDIETSFALGDEVVVAASRVPERILESPVSIERIGAAAIRSTPQNNYYDMITNLKGVDVVSASLTFRSVGTRGFNNSGNIRLNQLVDGMDNQAPGLNFAVGSIVGPTELDVESVELLAGASSALYGSGGMNGTVLINSKSPFKYQGLSFQIRQGVKDIDRKQQGMSPYYDWTVRWAQKVSEKFAFKMGAQFVQARDWQANQEENYLRTNGPNGAAAAGFRNSDPNYDGVNVYGDETNADLRGTFAGLIASTPALGLLPAGTFPGFTSALPIPSSILSTFAASPFLVSRTGYKESDVIDPYTVNVKLTGALHYKLSDKTEASFQLNFGTGNSVYTGSDRYSLKDLKMSQYKLEVKSKNWFLRAYTTHENSGNSFNATITTRIFNERWSNSTTTWYPNFVGALVGGPTSGAVGAYVQALGAAYAAGLGAGLTPAAAMAAAQASAPGAVGANRLALTNAARTVADANRPTGFIGSSELFNQVANTPISQGGGLFLDRSRLNVFEGQYNLSNDLGLDKSGTDLLIGGSFRQYVLNSQGTLFADTAGNIKINETGFYGQLSQKLFDERLKLSVSARYDKNTNFAGRFTPRASAVVKLAKDHNLRFSYQQAYRFPTTQNQWINLLVGGGTRLMGGLPALRDYYKFSTNPAYTLASVQAFGASALAGSPNPALLQQQQFGEFKPESMNSFEVGYKGLIAQKLLIDVYAYWARYQDFISGVTVIQARNAPTGPASLADVLDANKRIAYSISTNTPGDVKTMGWGASAEYLLPKNFNISGNIYHDEIGALPTGFVSYFNTPNYRMNLALNNTGFGKDNRWGFSIMFRHTDAFFYEGTFGAGQMPGVNTLDAAILYKLPKTKSQIKFGGTNILNKYYRTGWGNPQIGALYAFTYSYNIL
jgi:outer membrane receptor protein involved in Fe transport